MSETTKPDKRKVREYLDRRHHDPEPPPTMEEIRRELGWHLIPRIHQREIED